MILSAVGDDFWRTPRKPKAGYDLEQVGSSIGSVSESMHFDKDCCLAAG